MIFQKITCFAGSLLLLSMLVYCKKKHREDQPDYSGGINAFIASAPLPVQAAENDTILIGKPGTVQDGNYFCTEKKINIAYALPHQVVLNPKTTGIYPGNLLDGNSIIDGTYKTISVYRAPLTISIALDNIKGLNTKIVEAPTQTTVQDAILSLQNQGVFSPAPAHMSFDYFDVSSPELLGNAIGSSDVLLKTITGPISLKTKITEQLNYNNSIRRNKFIFRYTQAYYSIDVAQPAAASDFFRSDVSAQSIDDAMSSYTAPVYVASVSFGRILYFCIQSDQNFTEVKKAWEQCVSGIQGKDKILMDANFDLNAIINQTPALKNSTISSVVITGNASNGDLIIRNMNQSESSSFLKNGSNYDNTDPGLPVFYVLRTLTDNNIFSVVNSTECIIRSCASNKSTVMVNDFAYITGDNTIAGSITATLGYTDTGLTNQTITLWSKGEDSALDLNMTSPIAANYPLSYVTIDPLKKDKAYFKIEANMYDKDYGDLENNDPYNSATVYYYFNGNNSALTNNSSGGYSVTMISTTDNYSEWEKCCKLCVDKCRVQRSRGQNSSFIFNFQIQ